jgi:squalene cyclase
MQDSLSFIIAQLTALTEGVTKETRNLSLPLIVLGELGYKGKEPSLEPGLNLLKKYQNEQGGWPLRPNEQLCNHFDTSFAIRAFYLLEGAKSESMVKGVNYLLRNQNPDGGWGFYPKQKSDTACTAHVTSCLAEAKVKRAAASLSKAATFLVRRQRRDGSWDVSWEDDPMHHHDKWFHFSTPFALLGLSSVGKVKKTLLDRGFQSLVKEQDDSGGWTVLEGYDPFTWGTGNALMALGLRFRF